MISPWRTTSPTLTGSFKMMPLALDLISTWVVGWIFPVATTERARSMRSTRASFSESILDGVRLRALKDRKATAARHGTSTATIQYTERFLRAAMMILLIYEIPSTFVPTGTLVM